MGFKEFVGDIKQALKDISPEAARARKELEQREALAASETRLRSMIDRVAPPSTNPISEDTTIPLPVVIDEKGFGSPRKAPYSYTNTQFSCSVVRGGSGTTRLEVAEVESRSGRGSYSERVRHEQYVVVHTYGVPLDTAQNMDVAETRNGYPMPIPGVMSAIERIDYASGVLSRVEARQQQMLAAKTGGNVYDQK